jgi:hypothetical protein
MEGMLTPTRALAVLKEFDDLAAKHGVWLTSEQEKRAGKLVMIKVKEISIKVTEQEGER